jgi:hypothetical protein
VPPKALPFEERFQRYVTEGAPNECWIWQGTKHTGGYGIIWAGPTSRVGKMLRAHRVMWEMRNGPIPDGLECDHLCRNRACINPRHLALVTHQENTLRGMAPTAINARKTHCPGGHPYDDANTYTSPDGWRQCMTCRRLYQRKLRAQRRRA